jgi:hypothetical protein
VPEGAELTHHLSPLRAGQIPRINGEVPHKRRAATVPPVRRSVRFGPEVLHRSISLQASDESYSQTAVHSVSKTHRVQGHTSGREARLLED